MKILFLLSCLEASGSETYCVALAQAWKDRHEVHWISDRLHFGQTYLSLPISQKAIPGGISNTVAVARYVRQHGIQIIHSHSRRAHWVASQAAILTGIAHVTTIHQPPPVHLFSRFFPCLGDQTIVVDEVIGEHLARYFRRKGPRVHLIRNGIDLKRFPIIDPSPEDVVASRKIIFLGRLSGGRWKSFLFFLDSLTRLGKMPPLTEFQIVGCIPHEHAASLDVLLTQANDAIAPSRIVMKGWTDRLEDVLKECDGVIAGGRSALESMASGKPVLLLGEGGVLGMADAETAPNARRTNLGDHVTPPFFEPRVMDEALKKLLGDRTNLSALGRWGRRQVEEHYDSLKIAEAVEEVYRLCLSRDRPA